MKVLFFLLTVLLAMNAVALAQDQAWIVLDFVLKNGTPAQMSFNNPAFPDTTESECKDSLSKAQHSLIKAAIQREPRFATAKFVGARCIMSIDDPIKKN
jgi:hypothetical protein